MGFSRAQQQIEYTLTNRALKKAIRGRDSAFKNNLASGKTGNAAEKSSCCRWRVRDTGQLRGALCCGVVRSQRWLSHKIGFFSIEKLSVTRPVLHTET